MNKVYIYLNKDTDLGEVIEKIRETKSKEIVLVIPDENKTFLHSVNLEIFKKEIESLDKKVYLSTENPKIVNLAKKYNLHLFLENEGYNRPIVVDIKPPEKIEKKKEKEIKEEVKTSYEVQEETKSSLSLSKIFFYFIFSISIVGIIYLLFQFFQTRAEVVIETKKSKFEVNEVITLDKNALKRDYEKKILPAEEINLEINLSVSTSTTGKVFTENISLLKVTFLNYLEREITLKEGTRLAYKYNIFRTTERIVIPAKNNNEPGKITTEAIAFEIKDNNLVLNKGENLRIVALENKKTETGLLWSDVLKAQAEENFSLASDKKVGSVSPDDVTNIKLALENALKENIKSALAFKYPQLFYIFDPSLVETEIINISHKVGEKTDKISAFGKAKIYTLAVSQKDFNDFVKYLVNQEILKQDKNLSVNRLESQEISLIDFDKRKKIGSVGIKTTVLLTPNFNIEKIKSDISGKDLDFVKDYFTQISNIEKISIKIFPQWKNKFPEDTNKIKIVIK